MANTSTKLLLSALDFDTIKSALQTYLSAQPQFTDYNFAGSGLSVILNLLSYNSHYLSYYLNMIANEMYLDSADRRENIVSLAKMLGYTPTSRKSAQATINIVITPPVSPTPPAFLTIPKNTTFNSAVSGINYTFVTAQAVTVPYVDSKYTANNVLIQEGIPYTFKYTVNTTTPVKYIIPNNTIDTSTLNVSVQVSTENSSLTTYVLADNITTLDSTSKVYFLQEIESAQYEVYFGDGILGSLLINGNLVYLSYLACSGDAPNFANTFTALTPIGSYNNIVITTVNPAAGGSEREDPESVRFTAPKNFQTQDRAVTVDDYRTIITREYPNVDSIAVWGGETCVPPQYGKVFLSLKPVSGYVITNLTKQSIINNIIQPRSIVSVIPIIVDPDYIFLVVNSVVKYTPANTTYTNAQIASLVRATIQNFGSIAISHFGDNFKYSLLTRLIDETEGSITNDLTTIQMQKRFTPTTNVVNNYTLSFANPCLPNTLVSTAFVDNADVSFVSGQTYFFDDDSLGKIRTYKFVNATKTYTNLNAGSINYTTGTIILTNFNPYGIVDATGVLKINVVPQVNDIVPTSNLILVMDPNDISVSMVVNA